MTNPNDPVSQWNELDDADNIWQQHQGMTKLEYFTAAALTGLLATRDPLYELTAKTHILFGEQAVKIASETINQLNKYQLNKEEP